MKDASDRRRQLTQALRWTARVWAVASVLLVVAFIIGEGFNPSQIRAAEWLGFLFFPTGICAGMILAWWKEGLGGAITVGSLVIFYGIHFATAGALPRGSAWWVLAAPGFLFLLCWRRSRGTGATG